jgi:LacI family transcriptional regulator
MIFPRAQIAGRLLLVPASSKLTQWELRLIVYPLCYAGRHGGYHARHREEPERFHGHRLEGTSQPGQDQRRHAQAGRAAREIVELPDQLDRPQPGDPPHLHHRVAAAGFHTPVFFDLAKAVAETVRPYGYHVIITYFEEDAALERNEAQSLVARQVDGLIMATAQLADRLDLFEDIRKRKVPFVLIDRPIAGVHASFVGVDNQAIGRMATEHLIAQGCQRIAHLRGPTLGIAADRLAGYRRALAKHSMTPLAAYVVEGRYRDHSGYQAMRKLLRVRPMPDGVFCYNDPVAIGAMKAILEEGLRIPQDIAVVGAGNVHYSDVLAVPLSTVDQSTHEIGRRAAELLLSKSNRNTRSVPGRSFSSRDWWRDNLPSGSSILTHLPTAVPLDNSESAA